jgi:hypothetical protein
MKILAVITFFFAFLALGHAEVSLAEACQRNFATPFSFKGCDFVDVGNLRIYPPKGRKPDAQTSMYCVDYEVRSGMEKQVVSQCSTGIRGGGKTFTIDDKMYSIGFDLLVTCYAESNEQVLGDFGIAIWNEEALEKIWKNASFGEKMKMAQEITSEWQKAEQECGDRWRKRRVQ